mgnify:CR=1 FL=1
MVTTVYGCVAAQEAPTTGKAEDGGGGAAKKGKSVKNTHEKVTSAGKLSPGLRPDIVNEISW